MTRDKAIRSIVWCLLRHADVPDAAVAAARILQHSLGDGSERQMTFTNLLRAAGLFAKDDDGYFRRYLDVGVPANESLLSVPQPNCLLTFPVPAEPRMRIAYSVFSGLLLKYLYQCYSVMPVEVKEGMAHLVASQQIPNDDDLWNEFKKSSFVASAVAEGLEATLGAIGNIGGIELTETMTDSALLDACLSVLPQFGNKFQSQGGMRLDFYFTQDVNDWLSENDSKENISDESLTDLWRQGWDESEARRREVAKQLAVRIVREVDQSQPLPFRTLRALWTGEGSGKSRKPGRRDGLPKATGEDTRLGKDVDDRVSELLHRLDTKRCDTRRLHLWVRSKTNTPKWQEKAQEIQKAVQVALASKAKNKLVEIDITSLVNSLVEEFQRQALVPALRKEPAKHRREVQSATQQTVQLCLAIRLAAAFGEKAPIMIFDWRVATLQRVPQSGEWILRFLKKRKPIGGKRIVEVHPLGSIEYLPVGKTTGCRAPFQCLVLSNGPSSTTSDPLLSGQRCIVCGSSGDLLAGAKSFLPEAKKRHYETPSREESPSLCSNCAFIAYLSSIYPSSDLSIVEFPADNFLELFALYENLQGVSALVALKYINRVASMSVLPNRYLLLSHRDSRGRMDGKAQVYLQLRQQSHLLRHTDRPMRVQIEGNIPQMWSEILPYVPIGLGHFKELPPYYEVQDSARKGFAYEVIRALQMGEPYKAVYIAAKYADDKGHPFERRVFAKNLKAYEEFVIEYRQVLAKSLGGEAVSVEIYQDIADFSDYLFALLLPLVRREAQGGSSVSGIARKYTDLILREFGEGMAGKFLYTVCQEVDSAERNGDGWVKHITFAKLYGGSPDTKGKKSEDIAQAWEEFRNSHPVQLEVRLRDYQDKHGAQPALWQKFLREVQARTLALLMLNVRQRA
ncbi:MAG: hypothetical protein AB7G75_18590 [Candidatus Binatia bacterium]